MCTAATYKTADFYFGRTLDNNFSYGDEVTVTPRNYPFRFRNVEDINAHYAIIGMAYVLENYPLYYDAVNEKGLAMAGLNFVGNAVYRDYVCDKDNIAQFELIPWILSNVLQLNKHEFYLKKLIYAIQDLLKIYLQRNYIGLLQIMRRQLQWRR